MSMSHVHSSKNLFILIVLVCVSVVVLLAVPRIHGHEKSSLKPTNDPGTIEPKSSPVIRSRNLNSLLSPGRYQDEFVGSINERFGVSVAMSGDTVVVGAPSNNFWDENTGSAYIYIRSGNTWSIQQKITADDNALGDQFGYSVAISGNTVFIGAPADDNGSVYVFKRSGTVWSQQQKLTASDGEYEDGFGTAISVSDYTLVIGAPFTDNGGAVYRFSSFFGNWIQSQKFPSDGVALGGRFGYAVAIDGNTFVVGAPWDKPYGTNSIGSVYIFAKDPTWTQKQKIVNPEHELMYARSVAISGETIAFGDAESHGVWVYVKSGGSWILQQNLTDMDCDGFFFLRVALYGNRLVVGSAGNIGCGVKGSAYVFVRSNGIWSLVQTLTHSEADAPNWFGSSIAVNNEWIMIGAPMDDISDNNPANPDVINAGSVTAFRKIWLVWLEQQKIIAEVKVPE